MNKILREKILHLFIFNIEQWIFFKTHIQNCIQYLFHKTMYRNSKLNIQLFPSKPTTDSSTLQQEHQQVIPYKTLLNANKKPHIFKQ